MIKLYTQSRNSTNISCHQPLLWMTLSFMICSSLSSQTCLNVPWKHCMYSVQYAKVFDITFPSAILASGLAYVCMWSFSVFIYCSIGYIQRQWIGPQIYSSYTKWIIRCDIISMKVGRKTFSNKHKASAAFFMSDTLLEVTISWPQSLLYGLPSWLLFGLPPSSSS